MNKYLLPKIAALSVMAAFAAPVMAQSAGSNVLQVGWFHLTPQDSSEGITGVSGLIGSNLGSRGQSSHSSVSNADTLGLALTHFFTDNIGVTVDAGIPPTFRLSGQGSLAGFGKIGTAKQWSPAVVAKYFFGNANDKFRPFVGAGVTYVWYSDAKLTPAFQNYIAMPLSASGTGTATASLSSSFAPVASAGATYNLDDKWSIGFSVSYIPLKTEATINSTATGNYAAYGNNSYKTKLTLDPIITFLSVGYKF
jgi:outer membrane protein